MIQMEIKHYIGAGGKKMVLVDDGHAVVVMEEPVMESVTTSTSHGLPGSRFNPMQPTIGDLVGVKLGASQELCPHDSPCSKLHASLGVQCLGMCKVIASLNPNSTGHFDAMKPTVGDLVGIETVDVAASAPPVVRRIDGRFDPMQPTVGDLVDLDRNGNPRRPTVSARYIAGIESDDFVMHPRKIRMCSR